MYVQQLCTVVVFLVCVGIEQATVDDASVCPCFSSSGSNVTPQSHLDLKLWSCHTLRKELLGSATIDLLDTLRTHDGKSKGTLKSKI